MASSHEVSDMLRDRTRPGLGANEILSARYARASAYMATSMPEILKRPRFKQLILGSDVVANPAGIHSTERSQFVLMGA